jgi:hypothetical protein
MKKGCFEGATSLQSDVEALVESCQGVMMVTSDDEDRRRASGVLCERSSGGSCATHEQRSLERSLEIDREGCDHGDARACADVPRRLEELACFRHVVHGGGGESAMKACNGLRQIEPAKLRDMYQLVCNDLPTVTAAAPAAAAPAAAGAKKKPALTVGVTSKDTHEREKKACAELKKLGG